ncbi:hypothetical protein [Hathewaya massiliensis]|uniref:hypothetical protein n=1 Tax=Hathewaya massiliensis TaxID=1964382 RepID=UPI00115C3CCC|nr:hypothetical protein [Hathewaya massiliensis]
MAGINRSKISKKLYKQLEKKGLLKEIKVFREEKNNFKEKTGELYVCTIKGYYYRKENDVVINTGEGATLNNLYKDRLLVAYDDISSKIEKDDYFSLNNERFLVVDPGNVENIVLNMYLDRM